jgi:hypothetical protein
MKAKSWTLGLATVGLIALVASVKPAAAEEQAAGHAHDMAELHGGSVTMTATHHFEVLCTAQEARLYVYDDRQVPITNLDGMKASMVLGQKSGESMTMPMTYVKPDAAHERTQGYFLAAHDFSGSDMNAMKATFTVEGLAKKPVEFRSAVSLGEPTTYACPMHPEVTGEDPGKCGKCGMFLQKATGHGEHGGKAGETPAHGHHQGP